jgi:hypothetical protein
MVVVTETFLKLGRLTAKSLGMPDLWFCVIPHPFAGLDAASVMERGVRVATELRDRVDLRAALH